MSQLPEYLRKQAALYKLEKAKANSATGRDFHPACLPRIEKAYGSIEAYEQAKREVGITPDHAANFERYGVILQRKQMEFAVAARSCDDENGATEVGLGGARGPGKSFALITQAALDDCQRMAGLKVLYLRKTSKGAQEQLEDLMRNVLQHYPHKTVKRNRVDFANGSRIVLGGFKDDSEALKYQGIEFDVIIIEETTQLKEQTYKTLRLSARSSKMYGDKIWRTRTYNSTNPLGIGHQWYKKRFVDNERNAALAAQGMANVEYDPRKKFIFSTVDDNVFVGTEYVENLDDLTGAEKRAYRYGDWNVSAGAYFEEWNEDRHVVAEFVAAPQYWRYFASMDYGFSHWNVVHLHAMDSDGVLYTFHEVCHRKHHPHEIAPDIHKALAHYGLNIYSLEMFVAGNDVFRRTGNAQETVAESYGKHNITLSEADMSPGSRISGAHMIARLLGNEARGIPPRWFVTRNCRKLIDTIPYLERDPNNSEDVHKVNADENGNGGDDAYDGARYGLAYIETQAQGTLVGDVVEPVFRGFS